MRDCPKRGNSSPYVNVSSNCLLLRLSRLAVFHTVHYSQRREVGDQTDYQQGHTAPLPLRPAAVVGFQCGVPTRLLRLLRQNRVMQRLCLMLLNNMQSPGFTQTSAWLQRCGFRRLMLLTATLIDPRGTH